ncbi:MAG TPA: hypothetical protein VGO59_17325 [Verrucomicrobiae bacterium]|jgi:hypothetical protein
MRVARLFCRLSGWGVLFAFWCGAVAAQEINPYPRAVINASKLIEWTFQADTAGWTAAHDCSIAVAGGVLRIESSGNDPYLFGPSIHIEGPAAALVRLKCAIGGNAQIFWATAAAPDFNEENSTHFHLIHDSQWHDYIVELAPGGTMTRLRLDPAEAPGLIEVSSFQVIQQTRHPLEIQSVRTDGGRITVKLKNYAPQPLAFGMAGHAFSLGADATGEFSITVPGNTPFRTEDLALQTRGLPILHRMVSLIDPDVETDWANLTSDSLAVEAARDGSGARIKLGGRVVAVLAPLISIDGALPKMTLTDSGGVLLWRGEGLSASLSLRGSEIAFKIESERACEGPVLRAFGPLEQGLFPGLEYLAKGEHSSSTLDIETDEHIRFAPDPMKVTMPLMAFVTDRATAALAWQDMSLQPVFATPNFMDGPDGHRASLRGKKIEGTVLIRPPAPIEDAILWAVQRRGLPPLPAAPRSRQDEFDLCLKTLSGPPLKTADGWGHCAEASWAREPYADQASTVWRLTGQAPSLPRLVPGGAHIVNDSIYFVTGRAHEWLEMRSAAARGIMAAQKPDGSFRYEGKLRRGHFEDTASGYCAASAFQLLDFARFTGDAAALQAGLKALEFMKHFHDPRGAQTWEVPLHTPDILASAYLVHACVRGYQLTGQRDYLERARAWAISGLPFVYQWGNEPVMSYATIAVFGATGWRAPDWMGLPVQWCGYDYAYALAMLAPLDQTLDWKKIASGIDITAEQMQFPSGPFAGCEPDSFILASQHRNGPAINPCALVSLHLALEGKVDSLAVAIAGGHRVAAPFPVEIADNEARVEARAGVHYQVLIDGARAVDVVSRGTDMIPLDAAK